MGALTHLTLLLFKANHALLADGDRLTAPFGLTSAKWKVLGAIALAGRPMSAAAIGRAMGLSRQAALRQIDLLVEQRMLRREPDPADARAPLHGLTPKGKAAYDAMMKRWSERAAELSAGLDASTLAQAAAVIDRLVARLEALPPL